MRYISDDNKVFSTEQECYEHEEELRKNRVREEQLEMIQRDKLNAINKKYKELQNLVSEYEKEYGVKQKLHFAQFYEILDMLCR